MSYRRSRVVLKVIILGDSGVGKTSIMNKYVYKQYKSGYIPTIGTDFLVKELFLDDKTVSLQLWDTSGQERFLSLGVSFYRGSDGCILVYDVNTYESFLNLQKWREEFLKYASPDDPDNFPFIVIGNKSDLSEDLIIRGKTVRKWCKENNIPYFEVSAKNGVNINEAFETLVKNVLDYKNLDESFELVSIRVGDESKPSKCSC